MDLLNWKISHMDNTHSSWLSLILIVMFRSKDIHGGQFGLFRYSRPREEVLDSLSDRPWKEKEGRNANRRLSPTDVCLFSNSPDPIHFGNVQCQSHWMGKSPIPKTDYVMYFICWVTGGHFTRGFYQSTLVWFLLNHILGGWVQGGRF